MLSKIYLHNSSSDVSIEINSIVAGSIKYDKAISTSEELQFGGCIASQFQIEIYETLSEEYDELTYMQVDDSGEEHVIFDGIISNINTDNEVTSIIIAYDRLSASVNVAEWYEELFSTTDKILLSEMLNSLLTYLKYRFENVRLTNDFSVKKTVLTNSLDSTSVIKWICELQGGFGYFNGNVFSIGYLSTSNPVTLDVLGGFKKDKVLTKPIDKVQIRNEEQDIGGIYGEGTNALIIQGNPLLFGKGAEELSTIAQNLYNTVKDIIYVPYEAQLPVGTASLDMFTQYTITSSNDNCLSYVLSTSLTGSQLCNQVIKAEGVERRAEAVQDVNKELYVLDYKTTRLKKDVDGFSLQIEQAKKDADTALTTVTTMSATVEGLTAEVKETRETLQSQGQQLSQNSTKIEQTSTYIDQSVVKNNEVITKINTSEEGVKIKAKNIALEGLVTANENFKVLEDGSIEAVNGKFTGEVSTKSGFIGGWYILSNSLYTKKNIGDDIRLAYLQVPEDSLSSWIFSVQSEDLQGNRHGLWYVTANGDQTMTGSLTVDSDVSIGGYLSVPAISGDTTITGNLSVIKDVTVGGYLSANNGLTVYNNGSQAITISNPDSEDLVGMYFFNKLGYLGNIYMETVGGGLYRDGHLILDDTNYSNYAVPKTGGTFTGNVTFEKNIVSTTGHNFFYNGLMNTRLTSSGTAGYWKFLTVKAVSGCTYAGALISFKVTPRYGNQGLVKLYISNGATANTGFSIIMSQEAGAGQCYFIQSSTGVFDIYLKHDAWADATITDLVFPQHQRERFTLTWSNTHVDSLPSGTTEATKTNPWTIKNFVYGSSVSLSLPNKDSTYIVSATTSNGVMSLISLLPRTNGSFLPNIIAGQGTVQASVSGTTLTLVIDGANSSTETIFKYIEMV